MDCHVCHHQTILMKCVSCGLRSCREHYVTSAALCAPCARVQGIKVHKTHHEF
jgi:hypothetical protein